MPTFTAKRKLKDSVVWNPKAILPQYVIFLCHQLAFLEIEWHSFQSKFLLTLSENTFVG